MLPDLALALALKGAFVLTLALGAARLLRPAPAAFRHGVWALAFGALVALPVFYAALPAWHVALLPPAEAPALEAAPSDAADVEAWADAADASARAWAFAETAPEAFPEPPPFPEAPALGEEAAWAEAEGPVPALGAPAGHAGRGLGAWLLGLWALGALAVALRWAGCWAAARALVGRAVPVEGSAWHEALEHVRLLSDGPQGVRLLVSAETEVPFAWGPLSPAIVLPLGAEAWGEERRAAVLAHELAHLARGDAWTQLVGQAAVALHWFNPLSWRAYAELLATREHACDDAVLRCAAVVPSAYAGHLLRLAAGLGREPRALAAVAPMARPAPIEGRIRQVLDPAQGREGLTPRAQVCGVALALALVLPLAAFHPTEASASHAEPGLEAYDTHEPLIPADGPETLPEAPEAPEASETESTLAALTEDGLIEASALSPAAGALSPAAGTLASGPEALALVPAQASAEAAPEAHIETRRQGSLTLEGRLRAGGSIEVFGLNGPLEARPGTGDRYRVVGVAEGPAAERVVFRSYERGGQVVACAVFPGQNETCEPGRGPSGSVTTRGRDEQASVRWTLEVPAGVRLAARLTNGAITAEADGSLDLHTTNGAIRGTSRQGDVSARTTNGAIVLDARGVGQARTTNGAIRATLGATRWPGELSFTSTNGAVSVTLPSGVSADIDAQTTRGAVATSFPLGVQVTRGRSVAQGRVGAGGGRLVLRTTNGNVSLTAPGQAARTTATPGAAQMGSASSWGAPPAPPRAPSPPPPPAAAAPPAPPVPPAPPSLASAIARVQAEAARVHALAQSEARPERREAYRVQSEALREAARSLVQAQRENDQAEREAAQAQREAAQAQREAAQAQREAAQAQREAAQAREEALRKTREAQRASREVTAPRSDPQPAWRGRSGGGDLARLLGVSALADTLALDLPRPAPAPAEGASAPACPSAEA